MILKKGDKGSNVVELQKALNEKGFSLVADGIFGAGTEKAVKDWQAKNELYADGVAGPKTLSSLGLELEAEKGVAGAELNLLTGYYNYEAATQKALGVCLHHTVSHGNPNTVVRVWQNDSRGRVGTHFVIGRTETTGSAANDGKVVQCIRMEDRAYHIAITRTGFSSTQNKRLNHRYIGIELCSWGALKKVGDKFFDLSGKVAIPKEQVCILDRPFRTYKYWHKYTDKQLEETSKLVLELFKELGLDITDKSNEPEIVNADWLEADWKALNAANALKARQLTTHTNFEFGKFDCFPQPEFLAMIECLYRGEPYKASKDG